MKTADTTKEQSVISPLWAVMAVTMTFVLFLFLGAAFYIFLGPELSLSLGELLIVVIPLSYMLLKRVNVRAYIGLKITPKNLLLGIAFGAFLLLFDLAVSNILVSIFGVSEAVQESNNLLESMSSSPEGLLSVALALSLAGICEEFTFRGFLLTAINSKYSFGISLIVSSLAFGLFHFDPQFVYIFATFLAGIVLGYIYHRWHSYVVSATAHATLNLIVLALILLVR